MRILSLALAIPLLLTACGDDGDSVDCSAFAACGGDVVGSWDYAGSCPGENTFCPGATVESQPSIEGTFTFNADGTYTAMGTLNGTARSRIPGSCLTGVTSCDQLSFEDQTCTGDIASACTCTTTYNNEQSNESGSYTTAGTTITLAGEDPSPYCVSGNTLRIDTGGGIIVLTK
jgi:hypothetical protein